MIQALIILVFFFANNRNHLLANNQKGSLLILYHSQINGIDKKPGLENDLKPREVRDMENMARRIARSQH